MRAAWKGCRRLLRSGSPDCVRWAVHLVVLTFLQFSSHMDGFAFIYTHRHWARKVVLCYVEIDR